MKTLHAYLTDSKTSPILYCELTNLNVYHGISDSDYLFFFLGTPNSRDKRSNAYKWRTIYELQGYKVAGQFEISRRAIPPELSYKKYSHSGTAGVLVLRKIEK